MLGLIFLFAALVFFYHLGRTDIVTSHEARVAQSARLMASTGWPWDSIGADVPAVEFYRNPDGRKYFRPALDKPPIRVNPWLIPVLNNKIRLQKPPLPYWLSAILYRLFHFNEFYSRLPSALMGLVSVFLTMDLAHQLYGRRAALWGALVWLSTLFIVDSFRKTMADPELAFFTLLCAWSWIAASDKRARWLLLVFYVSLGLATLAKGPVIFLHLLIALGAYQFCYSRHPADVGFPRLKSRRWTWHLIGLGIVLVICLPWPLHVLHRLPNAKDLWRYESVGEFADNVEDARAWWFYLPNVFFIPLPWTVVTVMGAGDAIRRYRRGRARRVLFPLLWCLLTVLIFSFSNLKKNMYLLPMMPAITLLTVQGLFVIRGYLRIRKLRPISIIIQIGMAIAAVIFAGLSTRSAESLLITLPAVVLAIVAIYFAMQMRFANWLVFQSVGSGLAIIAFLTLFVGRKDNLRSTRPVATAATPLLASPDAAVHGLPEEVSVYLPLHISQNPNAPQQFIFTRNPHAAAAYQSQFPGHPILGVKILSFPNIPAVNPWRVVLVTIK